MYWVYLIIFTLIVFVPTAVDRSFWVLDVTQTQEFTILILGSVGFVVFLIMEKRLNRHIAEKSVIQKQVNRMTKDLTQSYSYIGEINRKLDILENIALGYPESSQLTTQKQSEIYNSIMGAIQVFGRSDEFSLRFVQRPSYEIIKEIKSFPEVPMNAPMKICEEDKCFYETPDFIMVTSPKAIDNIFACIIIRKTQAAQQIEDQEMMKTLASQALFLFMFMRQKKQIKCVI